jgi:hypothetical protein
MDIGRDGYWKPHVKKSSALSAPKVSQAVAAQKKLINVLIEKVMCQLTHLSLKIFPNGTSFDIIFIDSPIFNRRIFPWSFEYFLMERFHIRILFRHRRYSHHKFVSKNHWSIKKYTQIHSQ